MTVIGYHCSHEQFKPSELLRYVQLAEKAGFQAAMCSDHIHPWSENQGQSGFAWSWLGAAMQSTKFTFGMVTAPGQRYHPPMIAQAAATLGEMFPDRIWCAMGSGQWLNEHITGEGWLPKAERNARLRESVDVIRALWSGETVTHYGYFTVDEAKVYSLPAKPPLIIGAALSNETAEFVGSWADGIITVKKPLEDQKKFIESFYKGGGEGKPMFLQAQISYAKDKKTAQQYAWENWRTNVFGSGIQSDLKRPSDYDLVAKFVKPEDMEDSVRISDSFDQHIEWIQQDIELGFSNIYLHNSGRNQEEFIEAFGANVLPKIAAGSK